MMMFYFGILFSDFGYLLVLFILISKIPNFLRENTPSDQK
jgi:hypothetical protein